VQLGPDAEHGEGVGAGAQLARQRRVALARGIAHAQQQAARGRRPQGVHQLAAQYAQRGGVHQHHALARQPDAAVGRGELDLAPQVGIRGQGGECGHEVELSINHFSVQAEKLGEFHQMVNHLLDESRKS